MLCKRPRNLGKKGIVPCTKCLPCLINARRVWAHRLMLEADCHEHKSFITLTFNQDNCPREISKDFIKDWIKGFREHYRYHHGRSLRFYVVGEYGSKTWRPHYHAILFGYPSCANSYRKKWLRKRKRGCDCEPCKFLNDYWGLGFTDVGTCSLKSTQYVAGYVTKKMTKPDDPRLEGRHPEFAHSSRNPGIGNLAVAPISDSLFNTDTGEILLDQYMDIPSVLKCDGKILPLGRYMKNKIRQRLGVDEEVSKKAFARWQKDMQDLYQDGVYVSDESKVLGRRRRDNAPPSVSEFLAAAAAGKIAKLEKVERNYQLSKEL